uniref:Neuronal acetylcholine receptor subunit alpha-6 n=1 Tax=Magallana gigas TaxID=29159 RepID=A0A8W8JJX9_MAGGI
MGGIIRLVAVLKILKYTCKLCLYCVLANEYSLRSQLFDPSRHHPRVLPRTSSQPVIISLSWTTGNVAGLDEINGKFTLLGSLELDIWTPDIYLGNKIGSDFLASGVQKDLARIDHTGHVTIIHGGELSVFCSMDPTNFPFDTQNCMILFALKVYSASEVRLEFSDDPIRSVSGGPLTLDHPIWTITGFNTVAYQYAPLAFIKFCLYRKPLYYSFTMLGPSVLLNCLTIFAFLIPHDQGEKLSCGMTVFLAFVVFLVQVGDVIPTNSNAVPMLGKYYLFSIVGSAVMVIHTIVHSFIIAKKTSTSTSETRIEPFCYKLEKHCDMGLIGETTTSKNCSFRKFRFIVGNLLKRYGLKIFNVLCFLSSLLMVSIAFAVLVTTNSSCISSS